MKKHLFTLALALLIITATLSGCVFRQRDAYNSYIPTEEHYYATLTYHNRASNGGYYYHYEVAFMNQEILGEEHEVTYLKWWQEDEDHVYGYGYQWLQIDDYDDYKVLVMGDEDTSWSKESSYAFTSFKNTMWTGTDSFWYHMTRPIQGRIFLVSDRTITDDYIEFDIDNDSDEIFRISNNDYHYLLYYHAGSDRYNYLQEHTATLTLGEPDFAIPHLADITAELMTWE